MPAGEASVNPPGADDEAVDAVARMLKYNDECGPGPVSDSEYRADAEVIVAEVDRVRSRPDSGTENESRETDLRRDLLIANANANRLRAVLADLADKHHRTVVNSKLHDPENQEWDACSCRTCEAAKEAINAWTAPSPDSGTEPDTAKLVEALRFYADPDSYTQPNPTTGPFSVGKPLPIHKDLGCYARAVLAGFSVDAGNTKEKR